MDKSELVSWSSTFSVGIKQIDEQHKELFNITNDLFNHCVGDSESEKAYFKKVIQGAVNYIKVHFATEERIMLKTKFSGYTDHKREHDMFVLTVVEQVRSFHLGHKFDLTHFTRFLKDWVLTHIAISDKQYFEYFKRIATRRADGKLVITMRDEQHGFTAGDQVS
ncbi:MAG: bacteriohemerythrin [Spirochaetaceae bacterium]|jgi:hemerythrin|nr:bacteriohemerythrin [Spirochaetaceae bacterium]